MSLCLVFDFTDNGRFHICDDSGHNNICLNEPLGSLAGDSSAKSAGSEFACRMSIHSQ